MKSQTINATLISGTILLFAGILRADVRLPALFSDNMVLQQGMTAPVWGWADEGEEVKVTFRGKTVQAKAHDGKWMVKLPRTKAGGPDEMIVEEMVARDSPETPTENT